MDDSERLARDLLRRAGATPVLARRDELLDVLVARIDAGGVDVASAPEPEEAHARASRLPSAERGATAHRVRPTLPRLVLLRSMGRTIAARAAGVGIAGWILAGMGTAAAATGAWLLLSPPGAQAPPIATPEPSASPTPSDSAVTPSVLPDATGSIAELPAVDSLLDTVAPVISSVHVEDLTTWLAGAVLCSGSPVAVTATDDVGVTSVSLRISAANGYSETVALRRGSGDTWIGALAPLAGEDVGPLTALLHLEIVATDAAGNTSAAERSAATVPGICTL